MAVKEIQVYKDQMSDMKPAGKMIGGCGSTKFDDQGKM